jgi:serine phosphatase RsbU (regulator of sigma subunit)
VYEPHVQIIVDRDPVPMPLQTALNRLGARVSIRSLGKAVATGVSPSADVCVILAGRDQAPDLLDAVMSRASDRACATMVLPACGGVGDIGPAGAPGAAPLKRLPAPEAGLFSADELTARIKALCEIRRPLRRMQEELDELRRVRHEAELAAAVDDQLRLAGQVQTELLPEPLTDTGPLSISTLYLPADYVSGDIYDIARLDESRIGFSIADATGHGLPAALLTFLIKKSLRGKEIFNGTYRILEPDELLVRLNEDLLHAALSQCQFITAVHAIFDRATHRLRWARGGSPYPILVRPGETPRMLLSEGGLIGAFEQRFEVVERVLEPGDTVLFYTDGLEALLVDRCPQRPRSLLETDWARVLGEQGPEPALEMVRLVAESLDKRDWHQDDITIIALRMN